MAIDPALMDHIVDRILSVTSPDKIILFGSAATGEMTPDSDIDLLIVERDVSNQREDYVRIREAIGSIGYPVDLLFVETAWFEDSKDVIGGIAYPAHRFGKVIYDAA